MSTLFWCHFLVEKSVPSCRNCQKLVNFIAMWDWSTCWQTCGQAVRWTELHWAWICQCQRRILKYQMALGVCICICICIHTFQLDGGEVAVCIELDIANVRRVYLHVYLCLCLYLYLYLCDKYVVRCSLHWTWHWQCRRREAALSPLHQMHRPVCPAQANTNTPNTKRQPIHQRYLEGQAWLWRFARCAKIK